MAKNNSVAQDIRKRILSGLIAPGQRLPSERKLAADLGVSRAAIQDALKELQRLGLISREPNHRPVVTADSRELLSGTRQGKDMVAVWILPDLQDLGGSAMLHGIRSVLGANNYRLVIGGTASCDPESLHSGEKEFLRSLLDNRDVAGVIIWETGSPDFESIYSELRRAGMPVVFIDREPTLQGGAHVVAANHRRGASSAIRHLIELGHKKIAMVMNEESVSSTADRLDGYRVALSEAGIPWRADLLMQLPSITSKTPLRESAGRVLRDLVNLPDPPTAIFAINDHIALFLLEAAKVLDIHIPEELSIVGFDWLMRWLPSGGDLTSVAQPFEEIGRVAANHLLDLARSDQPEVPRQILLEASLVVKNTTAHPNSHISERRRLISKEDPYERSLVQFDAEPVLKDHSVHATTDSSSVIGETFHV